jgi:integral membrane protein
MNQLSTPVGRLRVIGWVEGISFLVLLLIAMPLKYAMHVEGAVKAVGPVHGALWIAYLIALVLAWRAERWKIDIAFFGFVASVIPFGPFLFDRWLEKQATADA